MLQIHCCMIYSFLSFDFWRIFRRFFLLDGRQSNWIYLSTETKVILLCGKSDAIPPDEFWTELCYSLTAFYDNILKKSGSGGHPAAKHLSCKFVTQTASAPNPPVVPCQYPLTTPMQHPAAPPEKPAGESAEPPEKPALPTPPANKGRGGNQIGGRAGRGWLKHASAYISVIRCCSLQYSPIGRAELQQRIQPQGSIPRLNRKHQYMPVRTSLYDLNNYRTASLTKRNALTTEPTMQIWHIKMWIIAIIKSNCKKEFTTRKICWITVWLLANSGTESHNEDRTWQLQWNVVARS
jgi:hypothetical protein